MLQSQLETIAEVLGIGLQILSGREVFGFTLASLCFLVFHFSLTFLSSEYLLRWTPNRHAIMPKLLDHQMFISAAILIKQGVSHCFCKLVSPYHGVR